MAHEPKTVNRIFWLVGLLLLRQSGRYRDSACGEKKPKLAEPRNFIALTFDDGPKRETCHAVKG